jgi:hypothetical protein
LALAKAGDDAGALPLLEQSVRMTGGQRGYVHDSLPWFLTLSQVRQRLGDTEGAANALREGVAFADRWKVPASHPARAPLTAALTQANTAQR